VPVGNAGNITSHWMGYREYAVRRRDGGLPAMVGVQAEGAAPLVRGAPVEHPDTVATAIRIGNPASWDGAMEAATSSGGSIRTASDEEILAAQRRLMREEGLFVEPASAASVAGLLGVAGEGGLPRHATVVCVLTGHGLKDPGWATRDTAEPAAMSPDADRVAAQLGLSGHER
jgi:threonine synthase